MQPGFAEFQQTRLLQRLSNLLFGVHGDWLTMSKIITVGCALVLLLQQGDLLPQNAQRLTAITILYSLYKGESMAMNPFAGVFVHLLVSNLHSL